GPRLPLERRGEDEESQACDREEAPTDREGPAAAEVREVPAERLDEGRDEAEPPADRLDEPDEREAPAHVEDEPLEDDVHDVLVQPGDEVRGGDRADVPGREPADPPPRVGHGAAIGEAFIKRPTGRRGGSVHAGRVPRIRDVPRLESRVIREGKGLNVWASHRQLRWR